MQNVYGTSNRFTAETTILPAVWHDCFLLFIYCISSLPPLPPLSLSLTHSLYRAREVYIHVLQIDPRLRPTTRMNVHVLVLFPSYIPPPSPCFPFVTLVDLSTLPFFFPSVPLGLPLSARRANCDPPVGIGFFFRRQCFRRDSIARRDLSYGNRFRAATRSRISNSLFREL